MIVAVLWWLSVAKVVNLGKFGKCGKVERCRGYFVALRTLFLLCLEAVKNVRKNRRNVLKNNRLNVWYVEKNSYLCNAEGQQPPPRTLTRKTPSRGNGQGLRVRTKGAQF